MKLIWIIIRRFEGVKGHLEAQVLQQLRVYSEIHPVPD